MIISKNTTKILSKMIVNLLFFETYNEINLKNYNDYR